MIRYTEVEKKAAYRLYRQGWGYLKISSVIGCSASTIRKWILKKGIEPRAVSGHDSETKANAIKEYEERSDLSMEKVARKHGVAPQTLSRWLSQEGKRIRPHRPRVIDRESILEDLRAGLKKSEIARRNHCSESWVYRVQRGDD